MLEADTLDRLKIAAKAAVDKKAFDLVGLDVAELTSFTDSFLFCSAASDRQVGAIVDEISRRLKKSGRAPLHIEGASRRRVGFENDLVQLGPPRRPQRLILSNRHPE